MFDSIFYGMLFLGSGISILILIEIFKEGNKSTRRDEIQIKQLWLLAKIAEKQNVDLKEIRNILATKHPVIDYENHNDDYILNLSPKKEGKD